MVPGAAASVRSPAAATEAPGVAAGSWTWAALTAECVATAGRRACAAAGCSRTPALGVTGGAATGAALTASVRPRSAVAGRVNLAGPAAGGHAAPESVERTATGGGGDGGPSEEHVGASREGSPGPDFNWCFENCSFVRSHASTGALKRGSVVSDRRIAICNSVSSPAAGVPYR